MRADRDAEDAAAVVTVLVALAGRADVDAPEPRSVWSDPAFRLRRPGVGGLAWWAGARR